MQGIRINRYVSSHERNSSVHLIEYEMVQICLWCLIAKLIIIIDVDAYFQALEYGHYFSTCEKKKIIYF